MRLWTHNDLDRPAQFINMDKTYCIFGDSVTQAAYVRDSWVNLLKTYLEDKYQSDFVNVFNLGVGGNTTNDILKRFDEESSARTPTSIIFAVGINDSSLHLVEKNIFESNLKRLCDMATKFSTDITFIGPVLSVDSYDRKRAEDYNNILKTVVCSRNFKFIQLLDKLNPEDFQDGLHPNEQGHRKMFEIIKFQ